MKPKLFSLVAMMTASVAGLPWPSRLARRRRDGKDAVSYAIMEPAVAVRRIASTVSWL